MTSGADDDSLVVVLSGASMMNQVGVMQEFARAFQFPDYFGNNWSALEDCLQDLSWLPPRSKYLTVITERDLLLKESGKRDKILLMDTLESVGSVWSTLGHGNGPVAFNVILMDS